MAREGSHRLHLNSEDDLIEVSVEFGPGSRFEARIEGRPNSQSSSALSGARPSLQAAASSPPAVIDLTAEPDSPDGQRRSQPHGSRVVNPRRTSSQRQSAPRLSRSDSTFMTPLRVYVDLTGESPDDNGDDNRSADSPALPAPLRPSRNQTRFARNSHYPHQHRPHHIFHPDHVFELEIHDTAFGSIPGLDRDAFSRDMQRIAGLFEEPWRGHFNLARGTFTGQFSPREESPKPPMESLLQARPGFTRNTCSRPEDGEETIAICPTCREELAYDPSDTTVLSSAGGKKRKRALGEHHFWALKKCGHVYCADCFENRKPTKALPCGSGFRVGKNAPNDLRCAVPDCDVNATAKNDWVGIFL